MASTADALHRAVKTSIGCRRRTRATRCVMLKVYGFDLLWTFVGFQFAVQLNVQQNTNSQHIGVIKFEHDTQRYSQRGSGDAVSSYH